MARLVRPSVLSNAAAVKLDEAPSIQPAERPFARFTAANRQSAANRGWYRSRHRTAGAIAPPDLLPDLGQWRADQGAQPRRPHGGDENRQLTALPTTPTLSPASWLAGRGGTGTVDSGHRPVDGRHERFLAEPLRRNSGTGPSRATTGRLRYRHAIDRQLAAPISTRNSSTCSGPAC